MPNLVLAFAELLAGAVVIDAAIKGDSIANVVRGQATMHPLSGGGSSSSSSSTSSSSSSGASSSSSVESYVNPVPGAKTGRIDAGVDYTLSSSGFLAPGRSQILQADASNAGWKGGGYIAAKLLDGPLAGAVYYVAEGVKPAAGIIKDAIVPAGTQLVTRVTNPYNGTLGNIEAGWASRSTPAVPQGFVNNTNDQSITALTQGYSFSKFIHALGGPVGTFEGAGGALASAIEHTFQGGAPPGVPYG
jgi:hypothetical protein